MEDKAILSFETISDGLLRFHDKFDFQANYYSYVHREKGNSMASKFSVGPTEEDSTDAYVTLSLKDGFIRAHIYDLHLECSPYFPKSFSSEIKEDFQRPHFSSGGINKDFRLLIIPLSDMQDDFTRFRMELGFRKDKLCSIAFVSNQNNRDFGFSESSLTLYYFDYDEINNI